MSNLEKELFVRTANNEDFTRTVFFTDALDQPVNLTGAEFRAQLKEARDVAGDVLATFDVTVTDALQGIVTMSLDRATIAGIPPGAYWFDLIRELDGVRTALWVGKFIISAGVTDWDTA